MVMVVTKSPSGRLHCFAFRSKEAMDSTMNLECNAPLRESIQSVTQLVFEDYIHRPSGPVFEALMQLDAEIPTEPLQRMATSLFLQGYAAALEVKGLLPSVVDC